MWRGRPCDRGAGKGCVVCEECWADGYGVGVFAFGPGRGVSVLVFAARGKVCAIEYWYMCAVEDRCVCADEDRCVFICVLCVCCCGGSGDGGCGVSRRLCWMRLIEQLALLLLLLLLL